MLDQFRELFEPPSDDDLRVIAAPLDFLGVNYYRPSIVRADPSDGFLATRSVRRGDEAVTQMDWIVRPDGMTRLLERLHRDYPVAEIAVTENGAAYEDPPA